MKGLLFLNGTPPTATVLSKLDYKNSFVICADGAYNYLKDYCVVDILTGDFDSILQLNPANIRAKKIVPLEKEKDFTDGHVAMQQIIAHGIDFVEIYGASGGRIDHEYCNLSLLALAAQSGVCAVIKGQMFDVYYAFNDFRANAKKGKTVSMVPFSDSAHILSTRGLKYPIVNEVFNKLHIKGISNVALEEEIGYKIKSGSVLIFIEKGD